MACIRALVLVEYQVINRLIFQPKHNMYLGEYLAKLLTFCEVKFGHKKYLHPLNPQVEAKLKIFSKYFYFSRCTNRKG